MSKPAAPRPITLAVPKGRILKVLVPLLGQAGIKAEGLLGDDRRLVRESDDRLVRFLLLKPDDVPTYVEYGSADLGVVGRDTLLERNYELYQPVDLQIGACRMVVAAPVGAGVPPVPRVATKYPRLTERYFSARGIQVEIVRLDGSVELAPLVGLADRIVDLVQSPRRDSDSWNRCGNTSRLRESGTSARWRTRKLRSPREAVPSRRGPWVKCCGSSACSPRRMRVSPHERSPS